MNSWFQTSRFDADIEKATSDKNTTELWDVIMTVCDRIKSSGAAKEGLKGIVKRLHHSDPHVVVQAITLLDACVINCGKPFHLEVASREFETEFKKLLTKHEHPIPLKLKLVLKKWAEGDFKDDPQLDLIPSLFKKMKAEGQDFTDHSPPKSTTPAAFSKDPNVVSSQKEEDDIAKAIELSLQDNKNSPKTQSQSLYPSVSLSNSSLLTTSATEPRTVRALYDFEAAEDNELTFVAGEIIQVIDDSDQNWWRGSSKKGEGLFPSNFVTADLSVEPESLKNDSSKNKKVQFSDEQKEEKNEIQLEIDEEKIDRLFHLLSEANPEDPSQDTDEMLVLENQVNQMGPLIDAELERVDRKHAQLTQLSGELVEAINLYHTLMRESDRPIHNMPYMGYMPQPNMYGIYQPMPNMFVPPSAGNFPPGMMLPQGLPMQIPHFAGMHQGIPNQHPQLNNQQPQQPGQPQQLPTQIQQSQPSSLPSQMQNGHMSMPNTSQPNSNGISTQGPTQVNSQQTSSIPQIHQQPHQMIQPHNLPPHNTDYQHHSLPHINMALPNMANMPLQHQSGLPPQQPQIPRTSLGNQSMPMQLPPQSQAPQMIPQSHLIHQMSGVSSIHLGPGHMNPMPYGTIQTILPTSDSNTNIPIYQQQRNIQETKKDLKENDITKNENL